MMLEKLDPYFLSYTHMKKALYVGLNTSNTGIGKDFLNTIH